MASDAWTLMSEGTFSFPALSQFVRDHLVWVLGITPFFIAAININSMSAGDPEVFTYILQNLNLAAFMLGVTLPLIPVAVALCAIAWIAQRNAVAKSQHPKSLSNYTQIVVVVLLMAAILVIPIRYLILNSLLLAIFYLCQWWTEAKTGGHNNATALTPSSVQLGGWTAVSWCYLF